MKKQRTDQEIYEDTIDLVERFGKNFGHKTRKHSMKVITLIGLAVFIVCVGFSVFLRAFYQGLRKK